MAGKPLLPRLERLVGELPSQREGAKGLPEGEALFQEGSTFAEFQDRHQRFISGTTRWLRDERGLEGTEALFAALLEQIALCLYLTAYEAGGSAESMKSKERQRDS